MKTHFAFSPSRGDFTSPTQALGTWDLAKGTQIGLVTVLQDVHRKWVASFGQTLTPTSAAEHRSATPTLSLSPTVQGQPSPTREATRPPTKTPTATAPATMRPTRTATVTAVPTMTPTTPPPTVTPTPTTPLSVACSNPQVQITSPRMNDRISGIVPFRGAAGGPDFRYYKVQFMPESSRGTGNWGELFKNETPVPQTGKLMDWYTYSVAPGVYWIRLIVADHTGNYPEPREIRVQVER